MKIFKEMPLSSEQFIFQVGACLGFVFGVGLISLIDMFLNAVQS